MTRNLKSLSRRAFVLAHGYGAKAAARRAFVRVYGRAALAKLDRARPGHGGPAMSDQINTNIVATAPPDQWIEISAPAGVIRAMLKASRERPLELEEGTYPEDGDEP